MVRLGVRGALIHQSSNRVQSLGEKAGESVNIVAAARQPGRRCREKPQCRGRAGGEGGTVM